MICIQNDTAKVYSNDKKLYVGMTGGDAYKSKEEYALFQAADQNKNDTISEPEVRRYNGPILVMEKDNHSKQRFVGDYKGNSGFFHSSGKIISSKEFDFYPGQKIEEIDPSFKKAFRDLDLSGDGELTSEEIGEYQKFIERKQEMISKLNQTEKIKRNNEDTETTSVFLCALPGAALGFLGFMKKVFRQESNLSALGAFAGPAVAGVLIGYGISRLLTKDVPDDNSIKQEYADVVQQEKLYKNVLSKEI